jgi:hypothetical protein
LTTFGVGDGTSGTSADIPVYLFSMKNLLMGVSLAFNSVNWTALF